MGRKKDDEKIIAYILMLVFLMPIIVFNLLFKILKFIFRIIFNIIGTKRKTTTEIFFGKDERECLENIDNANGQDFECIVADLLKYDGFENIKVTKGSGDYGADVIAEKNEIRYAIQCKRFNSTIGPKPIGEVLRGVNKYECQKGIVVTNNFFTYQAKDEGKINNVELWDREKIVELIGKKFGIVENEEPLTRKEKITNFIGDNVDGLSILIAGIIIGIIVLVIAINFISEFNYQMNGEGLFITEYIEKLEPNMEDIVKGTSCEYVESSTLDCIAEIRFKTQNNKNIEKDAKKIAENIYNESLEWKFKKHGIWGGEVGTIWVEIYKEVKTKQGKITYTSYEKVYTIGFSTDSQKNNIEFKDAIVVEEY